MKKVEISFRWIDGAGPLSIYWHPGPYGSASEATSGNGVAWFAPSGDLLGVEFDHVNVAKDHQVLELANGLRVEIDVIKGKPVVRLSETKRK